jgi:PAS domain-containing protein
LPLLGTEQEFVMPTSLAQTSVSSAELVRQFGRWQDVAAAEPVMVTHHGRGRVVLVSAGHYQDLLARVDGAAVPAVPASCTAEVEQLMEHVAQGFIAFDRDMTVTAINAAACCFMRLTRAGVVGRSLAELMPGVEESLGYASLARAAASGTVATFEMPSFAYEGRWLLFQTFPFRDGAACVFRDISDELDARRAADAKTATLAALAVHAGVGRAKLSVRGTFTELDQAFAGFAGFQPEGLLRARLIDIVVPRTRAQANAAIGAVLDGGQPAAVELNILARCGEERRLRVGLSPLRTPDGPSGAVVIGSLL